jgi:WD40 repeat protein
MAETSRLIRLFVCSTFEDFREERNALREEVFPGLAALCQIRGWRFQAIDLRWGVSEEASRSQQTLRICLEEIDRCRRVSPGVCFLVLLGERYGWRPPPPEIPAEEMSVLLERATPEERAAVLGWYRRDDNAVPPADLLRSRQGRSLDPQVWAEEERLLQRTLRRMAEAALPPGDLRLFKYVASVTHQEIRRGLLDLAGSEHAFCCLRRMESPRSHDGHDGDDGDAACRLAALREELRRRVPPDRRYEDALAWPGGERATAVAALCRGVEAGLGALIEAEIRRAGEVPTIAREAELHRRFAAERSQGLVGREELLSRILDTPPEGRARPQVLVGASGAGKTALLGAAALAAAGGSPGAVVVLRLIGATAGSSEIRSLLESLCREILQAYGDPRPVPGEYRDLVGLFREALALATAARPLRVFLDALDQLADSEQATALRWLPRTLPPHAELTVSMLEADGPGGEALQAARSALPAESFLALGALSGGAAAAALDAWLAAARRTLTGEQRRRILDGFARCPLPLYLRLAFEEARRWRSFDPVPELPDDIPGLVAALFRRLEAEPAHGRALASRGLSLLTAARHGLTEEELLDLLSADPAVMADLRRRFPGSPAVDRLPVVLWSRLFFDLDPYLTEVRADGTSLLAFYHRQLAAGAEEEYLRTAGGEHHRALAGYFAAAPLRLGGGALPNLRKLSELPFQQVRAGLWPELDGTLLDLDFLHAKAAVLPYDLIADCRRAREGFPAPGADGDPHGERRACLEEVAMAYGQELHAVEARPASAAQQIYNNLYAHHGHGGPAARVLRGLAGGGAYPGGGAWLRRLYPAPCTSAPRELLRTLRAHRGPVTALAVSGSGSRLASGGLDGRILLWQESDGALTGIMAGHPGGVLTLAWLPDDGPLASAGMDGRIRVWDWQGERELAGWEAGPGLTRALAWAGGRLLSAGDDKLVRAWDWEAARETARWEGHLDRVLCLAAGSSGRTLSGSDDHRLRVWEPAASGRSAVLRGHMQAVRSAALAEDRDLAVSGGEDGAVRLWSLAAGREARSFAGHRGRVAAVALWPGATAAAPDWIASAGIDSTLRVWEPQSGRLLRTLRGHRGGINALALDPHGRWLASGGEDGSVRVWSAALHARPAAAWREHDAAVTCLAGSPGGEILASGGDDATVRLWDGATGAHLLNLRGHLAAVTCVACPSPQRVISGSADRTLRVWDAATGGCLHILGTGLDTAEGGAAERQSGLPPGHRAAVTGLTLIDPGRVLSGAGDGTLCLWDWESGTLLRTLEGAPALVTGVAASRRLGLVIAAGAGAFAGAGTRRSLAIWDVLAGEVAYPDPGHRSRVTCLALAGPDLLITGGWDGTVRLRPLSGGGKPRTLAASGPALCLAADPGLGLLAAGTRDGSVHVWDLAGEGCRTLAAHTAGVLWIGLEAERRRLWSAGRDGRLAVHDLDGGELALADLSEPIAAGLLVAGSRALVGTRGGSVGLFELAAGGAA